MSVKRSFFAIMLITALILAGCASTDYTANVSGASDYVTVAAKDFVRLGIVTVEKQETHYASPFGIIKRIDGGKITYADFMQKAAELQGDDVINVRIDVNISYKGSVFDWFTGWTRVYTHTGTALVIQYTEKLDSQDPDPQLTGIPKMPESTEAVRTDRSGRTQVR